MASWIFMSTTDRWFADVNQRPILLGGRNEQVSDLFWRYILLMKFVVVDENTIIQTLENCVACKKKEAIEGVVPKNERTESEEDEVVWSEVKQISEATRRSMSLVGIFLWYRFYTGMVE